MTPVELDDGALGNDPIVALRGWMEAARGSELMPEAMALGTVDASGAPAVRFVLCRAIDARGVTFYSNRESAKAHELVATPRAAAAFHWPSAHRQVRVSGAVEVVDDAESDAYFQTRPRGSQISAWASPQSAVLDGRATLDDLWSATAARWHGATQIDRPGFWGGYRILWDVVEFWQGRDDRLHDRIRFRRDAAVWVQERLAP